MCAIKVHFEKISSLDLPEIAYGLSQVYTDFVKGHLKSFVLFKLQQCLTV